MLGILLRSGHDISWHVFVLARFVIVGRIYFEVRSIILVHTMNLLVWSRHTCNFLVVRVSGFVLKRLLLVKKPLTFKLTCLRECDAEAQMLFLYGFNLSTLCLPVNFVFPLVFLCTFLLQLPITDCVSWWFEWVITLPLHIILYLFVDP